MSSGRIAEFAEAARRAVPELASRLVISLRRRLRRAGTAAGEAAAAAQGVSGANRTLDEYLDAVRAEVHAGGSVGGKWDHANQPRGLPESRWEPGLPIDMPNSAGAYPVYDVARGRYWRNRAHIELQGRRAGTTQHVPGNTLDPIKGLSDAQLSQLATTGRAPLYPFPRRAGQTWELEHGVPQRVGSALEDLGLSRSEAARLSRASDPGNLMEVSPLEHSFFDAQAQNFGQLRADASGVHWPGTQAADTRLSNALRDLSDDDLRSIFTRTRGMDFGRTAKTRTLRAQLNAAAADRGLGLQVP